MQYKKQGFYEYYRVQKRLFLFVWVDDSRAFDRIEQAQAWIKDQYVVETNKVVHIE
jgi:hypothetical protein